MVTVKERKGNMDKVFNCWICKEPLGEIDIDAGIFDERYTELVNNHSCKTWTEIPLSETEEVHTA